MSAVGSRGDLPGGGWLPREPPRPWGAGEPGGTGSHGSPPWGPVEPVAPSLDTTQELPGLGTPRRSHRRDPERRQRDSRDQQRAASGKENAKDRDGGPEPGGAPEPRPRRRRRSLWRELPVLVVVAVILAVVIKTYVVQAFYIPTGSMQNTLAIGDRLLINKVVYHTRGLARGDIVVFDGEGSWDFNGPSQPANPLVRLAYALEGTVGISHGSDVYIKRVIGLPGDRVACCNAQGDVTVNNVPLTEQSYLYPGNVPSQQRFAVVVPPGRLWVMGDHREVSYDSRGHQGDPGGGTIPESAVMGRAFAIIWPASQAGFLNIPATFGQPSLTATSAATGPAGIGAAPGPLAQAAGPDSAVAVPEAAWSPAPLAAGLAGAVPLTWAQRRVRSRLARSRRAGRRPWRPRGPRFRPA
jgi:signal peptidase I